MKEKENNKQTFKVTASILKTKDDGSQPCTDGRVENINDSKAKNQINKKDNVDEELELKYTQTNEVDELDEEEEDERNEEK